MHEKTAKFIGRLRAAGIYEGEEDVCLECFKDEYIDDWFGRHRYTVAIGQDKRILLVAALLEAGITLDEIRKRMVGKRNPDTIVTDAEILLGRWVLAGCIQASTLIKWVEERATDSTDEGQ